MKNIFTLFAMVIISYVNIFAGTLVSNLNKNYVENPERSTELLIPWLFQQQQELAMMMPTCPSNQTIDLNPGECSRAVNFNWVLPSVLQKADTTFRQDSFFVSSRPINATAFCPSGSTSYKRTFYNGKYTDIAINQISVGVFSSTNNPVITVRFTNSTGTIIYGSHQYFIPNLNQVLHNMSPGGLIKIPARSSFVMEIISSQPGVSNFMIGRSTGNLNNIEATISGCGTLTASGPLNANSTIFGCTATPDDYRLVNTSAPPFNQYDSGDEFPIGPAAMMSYIVYEPTGTTTQCTFQILIQGYEDFSGAIACNDEVRVSLGEDCEAVVTPDMLLEGDDYGCYDDYIVKIYRPNGQLLGNTVTKANLGQRLKTQIFGPDGNSCWGEIIVADKLPPPLECVDLYATCGTDLAPDSPISEIVPVAANIIDGTIGTGVNVFDIPVGNIEGSTITDLDVYINITHDRMPDLAAEIISPDGMVVPLFLQQDEFECNVSNMDVSFDSDASDDVSCVLTENPGIAGRFKPASSLDIYNGKVMGGTWRVRIYDLEASVNGTVNDIHLIFSQTGGKIPFPTSNILMVNLTSDPNSFMVTGLDACSNTNLSYKDEIVNDSCNVLYDRIIKRCWTAKDASGNTSSCCQFIYVYRNSLSTIEFPADFDGLPGNREILSCLIFGDSIPPIEHTGVPVGDFCHKTQLLPPTDVKIDICPKSYKLLRTHKVIDWCTGSVIVHNQVIKVMDLDGPEMECSEDVTVSTDNYTCSATYIAPRPKIISECSGARSYRLEHKFEEDPTSEFGISGVNQATNTISGLPLGSNTIRWIVTDSCGNTSSCSYEVFVEDDDRPNAVCDIYTVASITGGGRAVVYAETFDDGSTDNCGIFSFEARKMTDKCNFGTSNFTPFVEFCCDEVNTSVMVEMRVTDVHGNSNTCMVEVKVNDKLPPYITKCPPDITLDCQADYKDLKITKEPEYIDNCAVDSVWFKDTDSISQCGTGIVTRTWTVKDKQNLRHSCVQVIRLVDKNPFLRTDIRWPNNYTANKCFSKLQPKDLPAGFDKPTWDEDNCNLVAAHYKDLVFKFADGACEKVLRTWTVLDWCTYKETGEAVSPGKYEYVQIIKLQNDIPPQFEFACIDRVVQSYGECRETVKFNMSAIDDCPEGNDSIRWKYELFTENGIKPDTVVNSRFFERTLNNGNYRVKWTIEDQCGNQAFCEHKLILLESKKPTPYCHTALTTAVMNNNGTVEIWAKDFDQGGYDNCTHKDSILFTFFDALPVDSMLYREHYFKDNGKLATKAEYDAGNAQIWKPVQKTSGILFDCNDIPNGKSQQVTLNVTLTDRAKNQDYCTIHLILQDNSNVCPDKDGILAGVSGRVTTNAIGKAGTDVIIEGNAPEANKTIRTDGIGQYSFGGLPANYNYSVRMEDDRDVLNGVSTLDLVMIQRHILGLEEFNDARKVIAADIDNSQKITAADLVALRKVILGISNYFPNGQKSWRFATSDFSSASNTHPFPFNEKYQYQNLADVKSNQNFFAIKIGDINHSAKVNVNDSQAEPRSNSTLTLETEVSEVSGSDEILIPVYAASFDDVLGYQFTLHFDHKSLEFLEMIPGVLDVKDHNFGFHLLDKGMITSSWNNGVPVPLNTSKPLFSFRFKNMGQDGVVNNISLSSLITPSEAYDTRYGKMAIKLNQRTKYQGVTAYELMQNIPNPFTESTQISFVLPEADIAKITITDVAGKVIKVIERAFEKGENHLLLSKQELGTSGVMLYKLESGKFTDTKKMILLE